MRICPSTFIFSFIAAAIGFSNAQAAENLSNDEISAQILDRSFQYRGSENGQTKEGYIYYKSDGSLFILTRQGVVDGGRWKMEGHKFCTRITLGRNNRKTCFSIKEMKYGRYPTDHGYFLYPVNDKRFVGV